MHFIRVQQMQCLCKVRFADSFAFAGADPLRPAEYIKEIGVERFIRQLDGPLRSETIRGQAAELSWAAVTWQTASSNTSALNRFG